MGFLAALALVVVLAPHVARFGWRAGYVMKGYRPLPFWADEGEDI